MSGKLMLFGGTSEGREILTYGIPAICCVATEYGAEQLRCAENAEVLCGRLDAGQIAALIRDREISCVIDATHPYAETVTQNIRRACGETGVPLRRVLRGKASYGDSLVVDSCAAAAEALNGYSGNVLLTTGSKELAVFKKVRNFRERIYARVLPSPQILAEAEALGFRRERLIAKQGPFTASENEEALKKTRAEIIVTKDGGTPGGIGEKFQAAKKLDVKVIVVARPNDEGCSVKEAVFWARRVMKISRPPLFPQYVDIEKEKVVVVGGGPIALRRAAVLKKCGAVVTVIAPEVVPEFTSGGYNVIKRPYHVGDLEGAKIIVAATGDRTVNRLVVTEAGERGVSANIADSPEYCDFFFPALTEYDGVTVSVSTAGLFPRLTKLVSDKIGKLLPGIVAAAHEELNDNKKEAGTL